MLQQARLIAIHSSSLTAKPLCRCILCASGQAHTVESCRLKSDGMFRKLFWCDSQDETLQCGPSQSRWVLPLAQLGLSSQAVCMFVHHSCAILSSCLACLQTSCLFFPLPPFTPTLFMMSLYPLIFLPLGLPCQGDRGKLQFGDSSLIFHPN